MYEGTIGSAIGVDSGPYDLVLVYRFLSKDLWIFPEMGKRGNNHHHSIAMALLTNYYLILTSQ